MFAKPLKPRIPPAQTERPSAAPAEPQGVRRAEVPAASPAPSRRRIVRAAPPSTAPEVPALEPPPVKAPLNLPLVAGPSRRASHDEAPYRARPLRELLEQEEDASGLAIRAADRAELRDYLSSKGARLSPDLLLLRAALASDAGDCDGALDDLVLRSVARGDRP